MITFKMERMVPPRMALDADNHGLRRQSPCHVQRSLPGIDTLCTTMLRTGPSRRSGDARHAVSNVVPSVESGASTGGTIQPRGPPRSSTSSPQPHPQMSLLARRSGPSTPPGPTSSGYSLLDAQLAMTGDLETAGSLRIDGKLEGTIRRADTVVLGVGATMSGDVYAREVVIGGSITGNIHATERVELQATAIVTGDVLTQTILVQEGGVVNGRVLMRPPDGMAQFDSRSVIELAPTES